VTTTQIDWEAASQLMGEIITFLEKEGITMPIGFDYLGLAHLLHNKNGKQWSAHWQEWKEKEQEPCQA
jgi:hypothetical protein